MTKFIGFFGGFALLASVLVQANAGLATLAGVNGAGWGHGHRGHVQGETVQSLAGVNGAGYGHGHGHRC